MGKDITHLLELFDEYNNKLSSTSRCVHYHIKLKKICKIRSIQLNRWEENDFLNCTDQIVSFMDLVIHLHFLHEIFKQSGKQTASLTREKSIIIPQRSI